MGNTLEGYIYTTTSEEENIKSSSEENEIHEKVELSKTHEDFSDESYDKLAKMKPVSNVHYFPPPNDKIICGADLVHILGKKNYPKNPNQKMISLEKTMSCNNDTCDIIESENNRRTNHLFKWNDDTFAFSNYYSDKNRMGRNAHFFLFFFRIESPQKLIKTIPLIRNYYHIQKRNEDQIVAFFRSSIHFISYSQESVIRKVSVRDIGCIMSKPKISQLNDDVFFFSTKRHGASTIVKYNISTSEKVMLDRPQKEIGPIEVALNEKGEELVIGGATDSTLYVFKNNRIATSLVLKKEKATRISVIKNLRNLYFLVGDCGGYVFILTFLKTKGRSSLQVLATKKVFWGKTRVRTFCITKWWWRGEEMRIVVGGNKSKFLGEWTISFLGVKGLKGLEWMGRNDEREMNVMKDENERVDFLCLQKEDWVLKEVMVQISFICSERSEGERHQISCFKSILQE